MDEKYKTTLVYTVYLSNETVSRKQFDPFNMGPEQSFCSKPQKTYVDTSTGTSVDVWEDRKVVTGATKFRVGYSLESPLERKSTVSVDRYSFTNSSGSALTTGILYSITRF